MEEYDRNDDWAPTARAHRAALDLAQALRSTSRMVGRDLKKLDVLLHRHIPSNPEDAKARAALQNLVETHGSLAEAVQMAMEAGGAINMDLEELGEGMNVVLAELNNFYRRTSQAARFLVTNIK